MSLSGWMQISESDLANVILKQALFELGTISKYLQKQSLDRRRAVFPVRLETANQTFGVMWRNGRSLATSFNKKWSSAKNLVTLRNRIVKGVNSLWNISLCVIKKKSYHSLHHFHTFFLSRIIEHWRLSNPWQMSLIGKRTKQSKRENAANISSAITTHTYGLTHWLASGWAIVVFFVFFDFK